MLQLQDENQKVSDVDSLLPIDEDKKPIEDEIETSEDEVVEDSEIEVEDPALVQTKHDFVTSPWSRLGIIGGAFGAGFLVIFVVLNGMMNGGGKNAKKPEVTPTPTPTVAASDKKDGDVYAKLALAKQQEELDALNGKKGEDKEEKQEGVEEEKEKTRPTQQRRVRQRVVTQETPPVPKRRVYREPNPELVRTRRRETVASQPIPTFRPSAPTPKIPREKNSDLVSSLLAKAIANNSQTTAKDPLAELERLRNIGSIGRVEYAVASNTVEATSTSVQEVAATEEITPTPESTTRPSRRRNRRNRRSQTESTEAINNTAIEELRPRWEPSPTNTDDEENNQAVPVAYNFFSVETQPTSEPADTEESIPSDIYAGNKQNYGANTVAYGYLAEEAQILEERQPQYLVVGSFTKATLVTPLIMSQASNNSRSQSGANTLKFVAQLDEPLYSNTGSVAIPAGVQVAIAMISVDEASGVQAEVTAILKDGTEYPLSPGTISVLGEAGSPLIARPYDDKGAEIAKYDATIGAVAGLAKVGEIINKPDEEITEDLPLGGTRTRSSNNNRNLAAAFLEGAFSKLSETVSKRTERATDEITKRPNVWYVPKNTKITIQVSRSIKL
ncbi:MAG: hypothetical protein C6Y22_19775 [Hapalosiphonaceae cyanobacterium JJU2]|nr:MAG: hypothetical protein C6Y22_19775 [Hapalosiphonaceae cyanobacterium JJU2]